MQRKIETGTLVCVRWHDAEASHGWLTEEETLVDNDPEPVLSVGWVVDPSRKTKMGAELIICADRAESDIHPSNRRMTIPWGMVLEVAQVGGPVLWKKSLRGSAKRGKRASAAPSAGRKSDPAPSAPQEPA